MHSGVKAGSEIVFWVGSHYCQFAKLVCSNMGVTWNHLGPKLTLKSLLHIVFFFQNIASSAASKKQCLCLVNENISVSAYAVKYLVPGSLYEGYNILILHISISHFHSFFSLCQDTECLIRKGHSSSDYINSVELHVIRIVLKTTGFHCENALTSFIHIFSKLI